MPRPLLPPRGIFTGTEWLFDPALSPNVKETLLQLMALTWGSDSHTTPALSYELLEHLTGKTSRTLQGHLSALRSYHAALRLQRAESGQFLVVLAPWLFNSALTCLSNDAQEDGKTLHLHDQEEEVNHDKNQEEEEELIKEPPLLLNDHVHDLLREKTRKNLRGSRAKTAKPKPALAKDLQTRLASAGIFPSLFDEIAARAAADYYSPADLTALLAWCAVDQPERPAALFITRLRAGARAANIYYKPACPKCGQHGKHAEDCPRKYLME